MFFKIVCKCHKKIDTFNILQYMNCNIMDYYNERYERMCLEDSTNYAVDLVIKGNKIYKVKNYRWTIDNLRELSEFIDVLTIKDNFVLSSSSTGVTTLNQVSSERYVNLYATINDETDEKYWEVEYVDPVLISSVN